jgi:hypothetical protein
MACASSSNSISTDVGNAAPPEASAYCVFAVLLSIAGATGSCLCCSGMHSIYIAGVSMSIDNLCLLMLPSCTSATA